MSKQACVIEIGSSKVICLIAYKSNGEYVIKGMGTCGYSCGYKYDHISKAITKYPDEKELCNAIRRAVSQAEHDAGMRVSSAVGAVNAPFLKTFVFRGERAANNKNRYVVEEDERLLGAISLENTKRDGYVYIHSTPISYFIDGTECNDLPIGSRIEDSLAVDISHVFLDKKMADIIDSCFAQLEIRRTDFVAVPLSEANYLIPNYEAERRAVLIDVGYSHTDISFIRNEAITDMETISIGGMHFTKDLEIVLEIPTSNAEIIKKHFNFDLDYEGAKETVKMGDGTVKYADKQLCSEVIKARMDEWCDYVLDCLEEYGVNIANTNIFITGGGLMMENCLQYIADNTGMNFVQNYPKISREQLNTSNNISAFASAAFVIDLDYPRFDADDKDERPKKSFWSKIFKK